MSNELTGESASLVDMNEFPSWIIFENENFLILNKPGWLVCHPSKNGELSSLIGAARVYCNAESLHLVSRLDRETSGVVVIAKNKTTASKAQKAVESRAVSKKYLAILNGAMPYSATVAQPLVDDKNSLVAIKQTCAIRKTSAKKALTIFTSLKVSEDKRYTLCEVEIITGRKHQIRAHAQWLGHTIVGDKIYGPDETLYLDFIETGYTEAMAKILPTARQCLHAWKMDMSQIFPELKITASIPDDFLSFAKAHSLM